jgi:hypothetical protein
MDIEKIIKFLLDIYPVLKLNNNWGEKGLFYNPNNLFVKGAYVLTFKEKDGKHDSASFLNREGIYRLNLKISKETFLKLFGYVPVRPSAGGVVDTKHDFSRIDELMPHPVYGWMTWVCVLNPSEKTFYRLCEEGLFQEAFQAAVKATEKRLQQNKK